MAVTITLGEAAVNIRAVADPDNVPRAIAITLDTLFPAAVEMVMRSAPGAPDTIHNAALVRLLGWLYESDPSVQSSRAGLQASGAAALLAQWRDHRAGVVPVAQDDTPGGGGVEPAPGTGLPDLPGTGTFILTTQNGVLEWVAFPLPG